ncbi:MAG: site-specific DNA-methyltransferase [Thermodesulfovibrionales bacterium]|jgi:site-specific DNA-methyltransferase (adenine-specific)|nr:site-specific DNA-methyltransferase [Thermodesulfovibrionales bacterium]
MPRKTNSKIKIKAERKKAITYSFPENPIEFYISEETASYGDNGKKKPFTVYYDNPEHSVRLLKGNCIEILNQARENSVDMIFADPPYFLSNGGITCHAGKMVSVNKGKWDKSKGVEENHKFTLEWLRACQRVLKPNGTIWVSGTTHIIYSVGFAMQELGYKILNDIIWYKRNAPPNLSCRYFTHSTEIVLWAAKDAKSKHYFDYQLMKKMNQGKQMRNVWEISAPPAEEKKFGKHPTQKPVELLKRIILASTKEGDLVLDPFCGSSTTGVAAVLLDRKYVGIDLEDDYLDVSRKRLNEAIIKKGTSLFAVDKMKNKQMAIMGHNNYGKKRGY